MQHAACAKYVCSLTRTSTLFGWVSIKTCTVGLELGVSEEEKVFSFTRVQVCTSDEEVNVLHAYVPVDDDDVDDDDKISTDAETSQLNHAMQPKENKYFIKQWNGFT